MADQSNIIREFLVALGFKSDEPALKKFDEGITKATKAVLYLGTAIEATAVSVAAGIARFASNLEALYFASQRTNTAVANILAFDRAAQNLGASAGEAQQAIEAMAHALRVNPGNIGLLDGLLQNIGKSARDANGNLRPAVDLLLDLSQVFKGQPFYLASQYANIFGIPENVLLAMRSGQLSAEFGRISKEIGNVDWQKTAKDAHQFSSDMRDLGLVLEALGARIEEALLKKFHLSLQDVVHWLQANGPVIADRMADIIGRIIDLAERAIKWIGELIATFRRWDKETGGLSTDVLAFLAILKLFGGAEIIGGVLTLTAAFVRLGAAIIGANTAAGGAAVAGGAAAGGGLLATLLRFAGPIGLGIGAGWAIDQLFPDNPLAKLGERLSGWFYELTHRSEEAVRFFTNQGWSPHAAAGIVANLGAESGLRTGAEGDNGQAFGLAQWHADRQELFKRIFGKDIRDASFQEQLQFVHYELRNNEREAGDRLRRALSAQEAGEIVARFYERPRNVDQVARERGLAAVNISQQNTYHIDGSKDPHATGRVVQNVQSRGNAELVRMAANAGH